MSAQNMLDQLLKSGMDLLGGKANPVSGAPARTDGASLDWRQIGGGVAAGGLVGLLLGGQRGRRMGGKAIKYGSMAALGYAGYRVYQDWKAKQPQRAATPWPEPTGAVVDNAGIDDWQPPAANGLPALPPPAMESHGRAMLTAMIAAAKADGHLDERERSLIGAELTRLESDPAQREWFEQQVQRPLDPADVARAATTPQLASEMYLASLLVADETSFMERAYLDELARQMSLPNDLKLALEAQARTS